MTAFAALDLLPEAAVVVDAAGTIVHRNERATALLGLDEGAVGKPLPDVLHLVDDSGAAVADCLLPDTRVADRIAERLVRLRLPDGRLRPLTVCGNLTPTGAILTFRHAGRRERVDVQRSDLVATVSHEIRSPLTSVKGFTRTLLAKWDRFSDEQKRQMLSTVNADADRVTRLLTELLDVSRIDAGRVQLHRVMTDVSSIVLRVADKAEHAEEGRPATVDLDDTIPPLYLDPDKLEQVLTNLVENALRYAPGSPVHLTVRDAGDEVEVVVADEGPGIPADQLRTIFGKFSRGRGNRRAGTGLGLYITRGLVEAHGGRVWAESIPGEGARFHVLLPKGGIELVVGDLDGVVEEP